MTVMKMAVRLLARREHGCEELRKKLLAKQLNVDEVDQCLKELRDKDWLSDDRFARAFVEAQAALGKGPERIQAMLISRGISSSSVLLSLEASEVDWQKLAIKVLKKKFTSPPVSLKEIAKCINFLNYRGFSSDHVRIAVESFQPLGE